MTASSVSLLSGPKGCICRGEPQEAVGEGSGGRELGLWLRAWFSNSNPCPPHLHLTRDNSMSKSIRVHSRPWWLGPSTWGKRSASGALSPSKQTPPRPPSPLPCAPALLKVYSHRGALRAPHFQWGAEATWEVADALGSAPPSPGPEFPCTQRTAVSLQCSPHIRFLRNLDTSGSK